MKKVAVITVLFFLISALPLQIDAKSLIEEQEKELLETWKRVCQSVLTDVQARLPKILETCEFLQNYHSSCSAGQSPPEGAQGMFSSCWLYEKKTEIGMLTLEMALDVLQGQIDMCTCSQ